MLAVTFVVSLLFVCGFYLYVLVQLRREEKRGQVQRRELPEHMHRLEPEHEHEGSAGDETRFFRPGIGAPTVPLKKTEVRRGMVQRVGVAAAGVAAVFAGIELFNSLIAWLHWN